MNLITTNKKPPKRRLSVLRPEEENMKIVRWFAFLILVFSSVAHGTTSSSFPVRRIKQVPPSIRFRLPRDAKSIFFGAANIGNNRSEIFLHYYTVPNRKISDEVPYASIEYIDLFQHQTFSKRGKHLHQFRRLNRIDLMDANTSWFSRNDGLPQFPRFFVRWLRPKEQRGSILVLTNGDESGGGLQYVFMTFPKGLASKPTVQEFGSGSNLNSWVETTYDIVDKRGFLLIVESEGEVNGGEMSGYTMIYSWDGTQFVGHQQ